MILIETTATGVDPLAHQIGIAAISVYLLQLLKKARWFPYVTDHTDRINRIISILAAMGTAVGIQAHNMGSLQQGGQLIIVYPSLQSMVEVAVHFAAQLVMQEGFYKNMAYTPKDPARVVLTDPPKSFSAKVGE